MGNFFTSTQIHNPEQLSKEQFIELFCNKMKKNGFDVSNAEDHEISYVLAFADNCKWVSVSSEVYEQGNAFVQKDAGNIAKMLNACCINVTVVDSDFAMLDMYSNKGKKLDTAVMGRADDYLGDDIPAPKKNAWSAILSESSTWERFVEVQQGDYVFVEDGLSELAPLLGMNSRNILFDAEDANEFDENTCFLYFKKASTKKPKKLTLNAAFKQVFGEALEPLGFVKIKSKHPYFVRVVNGEILHIITFKKESFCKNAFNVFAGIATVYRKEIDFDQDVGFNLNWMNSIQQFCSFVFSNSTDTHKTDDVYMFEPNNNQSIIRALSDSLEQFQINSLPTLDKICNLRTVIDFYLIYCSSLIFLYPIEEFFNNSDKNNENLLYFKIDDHSDMTLEFNKHIKIQRELRKNRKDFEADFKSFCNRAENYRINQIDKRDAIYNDPVVYQQVMEELERRKQSNIEKLTSYGLFLEKANTQKPKKLTLNAAFEQVFGEALEPLGFVKIKSKHPYFVRVVNGEILHIITYRTEQPQYPEDRAFNILGGVATVYRKKIDLSVGIKNNYNWLRSSVDDFYAISLGDDHDRYYRQTISCFYYFSEIEKSMLSALNDSLELVKKYMLPVLNDVDTLEKSIEFFEKFMLLIDTSAYNTDLCFDGDSDYNEGFLYIKTDYQKLKEKWRRIVEGENKILPETLKRVTELYKFFVDPVFNKAVLDELEKRKKSNIENLKLYGVNIN